jgi:hypothetical protein
VVVTRKLTPPQLAVLRAAKAGHVYRSERGHDLYACYDRARGNKNVTAVVERLSARGFLRIGDQQVMERPWHVTVQGDQALAQQEESP